MGKRVVVFGIFDGVHNGHRDFFRQARRYGKKLIVVVGRDKICRRLKNKTPKHSEEERVKLVSQEPLVDKALLGDTQLSSYGVLSHVKPDVICFGYDQHELKKDVKIWFLNNKRTIEIHHLRYFSHSITNFSYSLHQ